MGFVINFATIIIDRPCTLFLDLYLHMEFVLWAKRVYICRNPTLREV
jgi:hypothetical protein